MSFKRLMPVLIILLIVLLSLIIWRPRAVLTDVVPVSRGELQITIEEEGFTRVRDVYIISSPVPGYARRIRSEVGDAVRKGQELIQIDPLPSPALDPRSEASARARVESARAALRAALSRARAVAADATLAKKEWQRMRKLYHSRMISRDRLDQALATWKHQQAMARAAASAIDVARHDLAQARAVLEYSAVRGSGRRHDMISLRSPIDGRILKVYRRSEGVVQPGQALLALGDTHHLEVVVEVLSADAVVLRPGTRVRFVRWGGKPLEGSVRTVEPVGYTKPSALGVEEQRVRVIADIVSPPSRWRRLGHGYRVEARFIVWHGRDILQIPASALFRDARGWAVFVVERGRAQRRRVVPGRNNGLQVQILSGLREGERVVVHPDDRISEGTRIRPLPSR